MVKLIVWQRFGFSIGSTAIDDGIFMTRRSIFTEAKLLVGLLNVVVDSYLFCSIGSYMML